MMMTVNQPNTTRIQCTTGRNGTIGHMSCTKCPIVMARQGSSKRPIQWSVLEEKFVCSFDLCSDNGQEQIVPMSSLSAPLCVVKDYGADADKYLSVLPVISLKLR
jgi:hypothetical protein